MARVCLLYVSHLDFLLAGALSAQGTGTGCQQGSFTWKQISHLSSAAFFLIHLRPILTWYFCQVCSKALVMVFIEHPQCTEHSVLRLHHL